MTPTHTPSILVVCIVVYLQCNTCVCIIRGVCMCLHVCCTSTVCCVLPEYFACTLTTFTTHTSNETTSSHHPTTSPQHITSTQNQQHTPTTTSPTTVHVRLSFIIIVEDSHGVPHPRVLKDISCPHCLCECCETTTCHCTHLQLLCDGLCTCVVVV